MTPPDLYSTSTSRDLPWKVSAGQIRIERTGPSAWMAVWEGFHYQEIQNLDAYLPPGDLHYLSGIAHAHNRAGSASARLLCQYLMAHLGIAYPGLGRDLHGKPLMPLEGWEVSLSHAVTGGLAAVLLTRGTPCGVDLETVREKAFTLVPRYLSPEELALWQPSDADTACLLWCLKEAAYKYFSHKGLSLRDHLRVFAGTTEGEFGVHSLLHDETILAQARRLKSAWLAWSC